MLFSALLLPLAGCEESKEEDEKPVLDFFSFQSPTISVIEGGVVEIAVFWSKNTPQAGEVVLDVSYMGYKYKAVEGEDYTLSTKTLQFGEDEYVKTFEVRTIDNGKLEYDRKFRVEFKSTDTESLLGGEGGYSKEIVVTILDNDTALADAVTGEYNEEYSTPESSSALLQVEFTALPGDREITITAQNDLQRPALKGFLEDTGDGYSLTFKLPQGGLVIADEMLYWYPLYIVEQEAHYTTEPRTITLTSSYSPIKFTTRSDEEIGMGIAVTEARTGNFIRWAADTARTPTSLKYTKQ